MLAEPDFALNPTVYEWTVRTISLLEKVLKVNIKLHHSAGQLEAGEIFLFNHFARFETFIPQYLVYREIGAFSRSVAAADLFAEDDPFSRYLLSLGAVPTDYPELLSFLAAEVLRGRKVIVFPEGGMVKDRRVIDRTGRYSVYSRSARERRKHHTGAAVLALAVDGFKTAVLEAEEAGRADSLEAWAEELGLEGPGALVMRARRPTSIVPANITFYPIRISENLLKRGADLFSRGLNPRIAEELLIEGNILLTNTDMDIRLGEPVCPGEFHTWWERRLIQAVARRAESLSSWFQLGGPGRPWRGRLVDRTLRRKAIRIRDAYMMAMYSGVTVNLSHLASQIILRLMDRRVNQIATDAFHRRLYLAVKKVQTEPGVHLHRSLRNFEAYGGLLVESCPGVDQFVETATAAGLVDRSDGMYRFATKLRKEHDFDEVRMENLVAVYANEVAPIPGVKRAVDAALAQAGDLSQAELALLKLDDEIRQYRWDLDAFRKPRHEEVNRRETACFDGAPFFLRPKRGMRRLGVVLVHGFTASPSEMRPMGERLADLGFAVLGVRLKGHGTSPWDLLERTWEDWAESVRRGYDILSAFSEKICLVGFSTGGALSLLLASEAPPNLAGVTAVAAPVKVRDKTMTLVPLMHGANRLVKSVSTFKGLMLFHRSEPEHPEINYRHMPIRALYELGQLIDAMEERLTEVRCPVLLLQGTEDPTVDPKSADIIFEKLGTEKKTLATIPSQRHGILYEDIGGVQSRIIEFVQEVDGRAPSEPG